MARLKGERFCFTHSPAAAKRRRVARRRGGRASRTPKATTPVPVGTITDLQKHIGMTLADVLLLNNTEKRALAVARLVESARRLIEVNELQRWLMQIEQRLDSMERRT